MNSRKISLAQYPAAARAEVHTFIIRVWQDPCCADPGEPGWRGLIDHVGGDRRVYFIDSQGIAQFIEEQAGIRLGPRPPWWKVFLQRLRNADQ